MITLVFAQFGKKSGQLSPTLESFRKYFSNTHVVLYTDVNVSIPNVEVKIVNPPYDKNHKRYGNRCNDLYKGIGLLESSTEYAIALDNDMLIVSDTVKYLLPMIKNFGLCLPANPRYLVQVDNTKGEDSDKIFDESGGYGYVMNMSPIGFYTANDSMRKIIECYTKQMIDNVVRGPVAIWRAVWEKKLFPCMLPPQWCVCVEHCGIGNEIILHYGHQPVRKFYGK